MHEYYVHELQLTEGAQQLFLVWCINEKMAYRIGIPKPKDSPGCYFEAQEGLTVWDSMKKNTGWFSKGSTAKFTKSNLIPGQYFPRMARTTADNPYDSIGTYPGSTKDQNTIAISINQLKTLALHLETICQTVHPHVDTLDTYGHSIRNFLILACTEVEAQWSGVLRSNNYMNKRPTTNDYVKLAKPMRLGEFSIRFPAFPWLKPITPFENWKLGGSPTSDLEWLSSYNAVKHNREREFHRATLKHAFEALAACYVMLVAQFGFSFRGPFHPSHLSFFELVTRPRWSLEEVYLRPNAYALEGAASNEWMPTDFRFV